MKICFIADARSRTAQNWINGVVAKGHSVHVLATSACAADVLPGAHVFQPGNGFSELRHVRKSLKPIVGLNPVSPLSRSLVWAWRSIVEPVRCLQLAKWASGIIRTVKPDLVHALRIPIEGEVASLVGYRPLAVSVWGNDFTLSAARSLWHRLLTRKTLRAAAGLLADCDADIERARAWGLNVAAPAVRLPGGGGIKRDRFCRSAPSARVLGRLGIRPDAAIVVNPRGFRSYVRNDTFIDAIPRVLSLFPNTVFVGIDMAGIRQLEARIVREGWGGSVVLTGPLTEEEMAGIFGAAAISVSPSEHDGTPNTLLEAMACGCFPICGRLPSIAEWITSGENGILFDPRNSKDLADAVLFALRHPEVRTRAAEINAGLIDRHAEYNHCMQRAEMFYEEVIKASAQPAG